MSAVGQSFDGASRRLRRAVERAEKALAVTPVTLKGARAYVRALGLALDADPVLALSLFEAYDDRVPHDLYGAAFDPDDHRRLNELVGKDDRNSLTVVFELATRLRLSDLQRQSRERLAELLGRDGDADRLVSRLQRLQDLGLLEAGTLVRALRGHLTRRPLDQDSSLWSGFFAQLPEELLPELFEVRCFLGRGTEAVRLADTLDRRRRALECCASSPRTADAEAGRELALSLGDDAAVRRLTEHLGGLLFSAAQFAEALPHFRSAGRADRESECLERLGRFSEALASCPADQPDDLARLAGLCRPRLDELVESGDFTAAAREVTAVLGHVERSARTTTAVAERREELSGTRAAVAAAGRRHFGTLADRAGDEDRAEVLKVWSRFEEHCGHLGQAARRSEEAGDLYRAHRLYRQAERFGDAERVLRDEDSDEGRAARAEAREAGGDLVGAARLQQDAGSLEAAAELFMRAGDFTAAAACFSRWLGDAAIEDQRMIDCLRGAGDLEELAHRCLRAVSRAGHSPLVADELRKLRGEAVLPPVLRSQVAVALETLDSQGRRPFEERAADWVRQARAEIDRRFAGIWGLDLGTTTSAAAIYDSELGRPVLCPWKGHDQFASTMSIDEEGNELIGLTGEEIFAGRLLGHVRSAKRRMGSKAVFRVRDRIYRPEEVAARLIHHARGLVEDLLTDRVRERIAELARAELGNVREAWLAWLEENHDLRLPRSRVILTIPAYFRNNQKHATRNACEIAGVEPVRLIHEPTAACMMAGRERDLSGGVVVVDLGAGTLDVSFLDVGDSVYEVRQVLGDNDYGGNDFDDVICRELTDRLEGQGIAVPKGGLAQRRLQVAAEYLKVRLSAQERADYSLPHFVDGRDVTLELSRDDLARFLDEPLSTLRETCAKFAAGLERGPDHLVLVGGPMLSPTVSAMVEKAFSMTRTVIRDPRSAVACGAALQAAVLDGKLKDVLLLDVTPLPMGIRVMDDAGRQQFSEVIAANTIIPTQASQTYTTTEDNQGAVNIEIFNGSLAPQSKVGQFRLVDLPRAPKGTLEIEVSFTINASCVLEVTARDNKTGNSNSVRVSDTTLLSPKELDAMARRRERQVEVREIRHRLAELAERAATIDPDARWQDFRTRLAAHHPPTAPLHEETQRVLLEIFNESGDAETELILAGGPLRDLAAKAREYLDRPEGKDDLAEAQLLEGQLRERLDRLDPHLSRLTRWMAVLDQVAAAESDPLSRFRHLHDTGAYVRALETLGELAGPLEHSEDIDRRLRCLAEVGDGDAYREVLIAEAPRLGISVLGEEGPAAFLVRAGGAFVRIRTAHAEGSGFLVSDRLVVTNRHWLTDQTVLDERAVVAPSQVEVALGAGTTRVLRFHLPESPYLDLAVLRLAEPVVGPSLRLGHGALVRVGDTVHAADPGTVLALREGVVNGFESFSEQDLHLYRTELEVTPRASGGPLLNALGEVVGVLAVGEGSSRGTFALTIDSLTPLLTAATAAL
jgi:molecular chaperone DnaK